MFDLKVVESFTSSTATVHTDGHAPYELYALEVPVDMIPNVAECMRGLSRRVAHANDIVQSNGQKYYLAATRGRCRTDLLRTRLVTMHPGAKMLQLVPIDGWPREDDPRRCTPREAWVERVRAIMG